MILQLGGLSEELRNGLHDSKKFKSTKREKLFQMLREQARIGIGISSVEEIDQVNILQATMIAMERAIDDLADPPPDLALIDGNRAPKAKCEARTVVKGDSKVLSVSAASIVAKVTRDNLMVELGEQYPGYGWARNAGYGTREHQSALMERGVTPVHRRSFAPIRKMLSLGL